jgi:hypothetical protein
MRQKRSSTWSPTLDRTAPASRFKHGGFFMLWTIAVIMLVLWVLGLVSSYTLGGFIHVLLVAAIVLVAVRLIQGRSVTSP